jgi:hypothetical protein
MAFDTSKLKTGTANTEDKKRARFTPNIWWADGDVKTIVFVTEILEIPEVFVHEFVKVPDSSDRGWHYELFLCWKDPSMSASTGNVCPLCEKGYKPKKRWIGHAVELEPVLTGKKVTGLEIKRETYTNRENEEVEAIRHGLVIQGKKNFYKMLAAMAEKDDSIRDTAYEVTRKGSDQHTIYVFYPLSRVEIPDLTDVLEELPSLNDLLEAMSTEEKYSVVAEVDVAEEKVDDVDTPAAEGFEAVKDEVAKAIAAAQTKEPVEAY